MFLKQIRYIFSYTNYLTYFGFTGSTYRLKLEHLLNLIVIIIYSFCVFSFSKYRGESCRWVKLFVLHTVIWCWTWNRFSRIQNVQNNEQTMVEFCKNRVCWWVKTVPLMFINCIVCLFFTYNTEFVMDSVKRFILGTRIRRIWISNGQQRAWTIPNIYQ